MSKVWLIVQREYWSRVKTRQFILTTLLTPLALALFIAVVGLIFSYRSDEEKSLLVVDPSGVLDANVTDWDNLTLDFTDQPIDGVRENFDSESYEGILFLPETDTAYGNRYTVYYYADRDLDLQDRELISSRIRTRVRDHRMQMLGIRQDLLDRVNVSVTLDPEPLRATPEGETKQDASPMRSAIAAILGIFIGMIMYFMVFFNGYRIMRSVMEEKVNRIVELMISTVSPFQLMMGKLLGVGAVGITQMLFWLISVVAIVMGAQLVFGVDLPSGSAGGASYAQASEAFGDETLGLIFADLYSLNWALILPLLVIYYIGGYLIYSSLFAAAGSAIGDDMGEAQSLTMPITIPIILALYIAIATVQAPNSTLAVVSSLIPFFTPIVMPARLVFDPPMWQVALSVVLLILGVLFCIWMSARIYRTGILLYGKKVNLKEMGKWLFIKR